MPITLYDYTTKLGENEFKAWSERLQKVQLAKLNEKLDKLSQYGEGLRPQLLADTGVVGINKLRIHGNVQLRPLLCNGPVNVTTEYTLLMGAKEVGNKWMPKKAPEIAQLKKEEVVVDPQNRRKRHERII